MGSSRAAFLLRGAWCCYHGAATVAAAVAALHAVALLPCSLWAVTLSLLAPAQGKYKYIRQSCWYSVRPSQEPQTWCLASSDLCVTATDWGSEVQPEPAPPFIRLKHKSGPLPASWAGCEGTFIALSLLIFYLYLPCRWFPAEALMLSYILHFRSTWHYA